MLYSEWTPRNPKRSTATFEWKRTKKTHRGRLPTAGLCYCATKTGHPKHRLLNSQLPNIPPGHPPNSEELKSEFKQTQITSEYDNRKSENSITSKSGPPKSENSITSKSKPPKFKNSINPKSYPPKPENSIIPKSDMAIPKIRTMDPRTPIKPAIFKSPSRDLSRTFLKPESPKTQIPGDGDSRRPRRPRRTTTHSLSQSSQNQNSPHIAIF